MPHMQIDTGELTSSKGNQAALTNLTKINQQWMNNASGYIGDCRSEASIQ